MRLISCYIENFGKLSSYSRDFTNNLTIVMENNGFGKTTLAVFICTMFYGMPRSNKNLNKDIRKHYMPWQGGSYGGNLVFETADGQYKIERTFGKKPAQDTFTLYDAVLNKKSTDYSENIGLELFGLDQESFERSIYMPQMFLGTNLTTTSIQAKLGDLVEDTNDVNNFESAINALKAKRSLFQQYRGSSGSIDDAQKRITMLQDEIEYGSVQRDQLEKVKIEYEDKKKVIAQKDKELVKIRSLISETSKAEAAQSLRREYKSMINSQTEYLDEKSAIDRRYPNGLPALSKVNEILAIAQECDILDSGINTESNVNNETESIINRLKNRFAKEVPSEEKLTQISNLNKEYIEAESALSQIGLSEDENSQIKEFEQYFIKGIPSDEVIESAGNNLKEIEKLSASKNYQKLSDTDLNKLNELNKYFNGYIPEDDEIINLQNMLKRADDLKQENAQIASNVANLHESNKNEPETKKTTSTAIPIFISGTVFLIVGAVLLALKMLLPGAVMIAVGAVALAGAIYVNMTNTVKREVASQVTTGKIDPQLQEKLKLNSVEIANLENEVINKLIRYDNGNISLKEAVSSLRTKKELYSELINRENELNSNLNDINNKLHDKVQQLIDFLSEYYQSPVGNYTELQTLIQNKTQLLQLRNRNNIYLSKKNELNQKADKLKVEIMMYLQIFYDEEISPEHFTSLITSLQRDATVYRQALNSDAEAKEALALRKSRYTELRNIIEEFMNEFGMSLKPPYQNQIMVMKESINELNRLAPLIKRINEQISQFVETNAEVIREDSKLLVENNLSDLNDKEQRIIADINTLRNDEINLKQRLDNLQLAIDKLIEKQDELDEKTAFRNSHIQKRNILDITIEMLEMSRDNLTNSYLGPVKESFNLYSKDLFGTDIGKVYMNPKLDVSIERYGAERELAYFSAGYTDIIMICMRLALIDALFKKEMPFVILDDPFVNLDDNYTEKALELLYKLSEKKQIVYMVCNSSRAKVIQC